MNTAAFEFNVGDKVMDDIQGGLIEVVGVYREGDINKYECTTPQNYIVYRTENDLIKQQ